MNIENHTNNLKAIKEQLLRGWRITVLSVLNSVHTIDARKYISTLRKDPNLIIKDKWVSKNGKRFKEYYLENKAA